MAAPTDPSLRRGRKTSEFLLSAVTITVTTLVTLLVFVDALAASVPPQYEAILASVSAFGALLTAGLYSLGRSLAKARAASSIPAYLETLEVNRVNSYNIEMQERREAQVASPTVGVATTPKAEGDPEYLIEG